MNSSRLKLRIWLSLSYQGYVFSPDLKRSKHSQQAKVYPYSLHSSRLKLRIWLKKTEGYGFRSGRSENLRM